MPSRRDVLQGCLLAGVFLGIPAAARGEEIQWTARWKIKETDDGRLVVRVVVRPTQDSELHVVLGESGEGEVSGPLTAMVGEEPRMVQSTSDVPIYSRVMTRRTVRAVAMGESVELGPWTVESTRGDVAKLAVVLDAAQSVTLPHTHVVGMPSFAAVWEARRSGRESVAVYVALTPDRHVELNLIDGRPRGFSVLQGGTLKGAPGGVSRAGPRPVQSPIAQDETRTVGGWLVRATEPVLVVSLTLSHDRGQTHIKAEVPVQEGGA